MSQLPKTFRRFVLLLGISIVTMNSTGCVLATGIYSQLYASSLMWQTTPPILVPASWSESIENAYLEDTRYNKVPVLDPIEGEHAPLFCLDPPSHDEVMRALPDNGTGGVPYLAETHINNVQIVIEPIVDRIGDCRFFPLVGPARIKYCHYKCTVYYDKKISSSWPVPYSYTKQTQEVVYIDKNYLIRCAGPATPQ